MTVRELTAMFHSDQRIGLYTANPLKVSPAKKIIDLIAPGGGLRDALELEIICARAVDDVLFVLADTAEVYDDVE